MIIQHNMTAMYASRQNVRSRDRISKNTEKLSSGYRINRSADDAAGLSISEKMRGQIRGLERAAQNAQDGVSLLQTADGALNESHSLVQRIRELAVQAANDTNVDADREALQEEINQLLEEVDNIAENTEFNTLKLLNGSLEGTMPYIQSQMIEQGQKLLTLEEIKNYDGLKLIYTEIENSVETNQDATGSATISGYDDLKNILKTEMVPQAVKAILDTFGDTFGYLKDSSIGIGLRLYSDASSSTLASVTVGASGYVNDMDVSYKLSVNLAHINSGVLDADTRNDLEVTIVHEMMHAMMDETLTNGMLGFNGSNFTATERFPLWFVEGMAQSAAGGCYNGNDWVNRSLGITEATSESDISTILKNNAVGSDTTISNYGTGYLACMYLGYMANGSSSSTASSIASGLDTILNDIKGGKSLDQAIADNTVYSGLSDFQNSFGDTASAKFVKELVGAIGTSGSGGLVTGDYTDSNLLPDSSHATNLFELNITNEEVTNSYPNGYTVLSGGTKTGTGTALPNSGTTGGSGGTGGSGTPGGTGGVGGGPTVNGALKLHIGANSGQAIGVSIDDMHAAAIGLSNVSVNNQANAELAISACDEAIEKISTNRSKIGAYTNRLEHAISNLENTAENLQAAESRIRDADMAELMVEYSKENILIQASQAMLAQANGSTEGILRLLQ